MAVAARHIEPFNVRQFLVAALAGSSASDPAVIADEIIDACPDDHLRELLRYCLPLRVRVLIHFDRQDIRSSTKVDDDAPKPGPSKFAGVGDIYRRFMAERVFASGEWKLRGDCTVADVEAIAAARFDQAKATAAEGEREQLLAKAMRRHKASKVAELPEAAVLEVLRWKP